MAKVKTIRIVKINLELTLEEAKYLKYSTQNYLGNNKEPLSHSELRGKIFYALNDIKELN